MKVSVRLLVAMGLVIAVLGGALITYQRTVVSARDGYLTLLRNEVALSAHADKMLIHLNAARHAKAKFLLRKDMAYASDHYNAMAAMRDEARSLTKIATVREDTVELESARAYLAHSNSYERQFKAVVQAWTTRGLDHDSGLQGEMRVVAHDFADHLQVFMVDDLLLALLKLQSAENNYLRQPNRSNNVAIARAIDQFTAVLQESRCEPEAKMAQQKFLLVYNDAYHLSLDNASSNSWRIAMQDAGRGIERALLSVRAPRVGELILQVRRSEKDYILRGEKKYVDRVHQQLNNILDAFQNPSMQQRHRIAAAGYVDEYRQLFDALVAQDTVIEALVAEIDLATEQMEVSALKISALARTSAIARAVATDAGVEQGSGVALIAGVAGGLLSLFVTVLFWRNVAKIETEQLELAESVSAELWQKTGVSGLAGAMRGELEPGVLCQNALSFLADYLDAQMGALYFLDDSSECLTLKAGYAWKQSEPLFQNIELGEGIAGQAAQERKTIAVTDIPEDYIKVSSTLGMAPPRYIVAAPLYQGESLMGVVELASFKVFSSEENDFLTRAGGDIAIALYSARARQQMAELLAETQAQSEELEHQQVELQAANEELEQRRSELESSNEELQQQGEELRASNEELEDKSDALEQQRAQLQTRTQEIEGARDDLERKAEELEAASKYKSEFLANMSHELRTPLNSLLILAKMLSANETGNLSEDQIESASIIYSGGRDLLSLINEILDLSKVEAGMMEVHQDEVPLAGLLEGMERQFSGSALEHGLQLITSLAPGLPRTIITDGQRLEQILRNFLSNALKFTSEGSVTLTVEQADESVTFSDPALRANEPLAFRVRDTGMGIPAEKIGMIFGAFQQADGSTSRQFGGTGLGLSISKALSELLGGEILVESTLGEGAAFTLYLPREHQVGTKSVEPQRLVTPPPPRAIRQQPMAEVPAKEERFLADDRDKLKPGDQCVLVIEDDIGFASILTRRVSAGGFMFLAAATGGAGLRLAESYQPSAIILDLGLPDIDGLAVLDELKHNLSTRHIPVHVMSARDEPPEIRLRGALGYLTKPVQMEHIDAALERIEDVVQATVKRVLIVEDDNNSRRAIEKLIHIDDVEILGAASGAEAQALIRKHHFDCIILDLGLPDMNGHELLEKLSEEFELPPVVIYTGKELTSAELRELSRFTTSVVIKGANSPEHLLDEVSLFLHTVESSLPEEQQQMLRILHKRDDVPKGKKILLVDDDMRNSYAMSKALKQADMEVVIAENGQVALDLLAEHPDIDLVLMDIMMPVMDGYEAIAKIRAQKAHRELPIIALTAKAMSEDRVKCIEVGANDYLSKPIEIEKLMSLMRVQLFK